jgi:NitT/TauT family transport system substrate-binding protein
MKNLLRLTLACLAALGVAPLGAEPVHLAIGYIPHIQFAPLYVGMEKGYYRDVGVELDIEYGFGIDIFSLLATGRIDLGLSDSDQLIVAGSKGLPLAAIYQYYQRYPASIVALRSRVSRPEDLGGRTVGTPELFGTSYIGLRLFLERYGLEGRVTVQRIGYTQLASLDSGKADAVVVFTNNEPIQLRASGYDIVEWKVSDLSDMVGASFISSSATIAAKRDLLGRFVKATRRAMEYTYNHREEAVALSRTYIGAVEPGKEAQVLAVLEATCDLYLSPEGWGHLDPDVYTRSLAVLQRLGMVDAAYPVTRILAPLGE